MRQQPSRELKSGCSGPQRTAKEEVATEPRGGQTVRSGRRRSWGAESAQSSICCRSGWPFRGPAGPLASESWRTFQQLLKPGRMAAMKILCRGSRQISPRGVEGKLVKRQQPRSCSRSFPSRISSKRCRDILSRFISLNGNRSKQWRHCRWLPQCRPRLCNQGLVWLSTQASLAFPIQCRL